MAICEHGLDQYRAITYPLTTGEVLFKNEWRCPKCGRVVRLKPTCPEELEADGG